MADAMLGLAFCGSQHLLRPTPRFEPRVRPSRVPTAHDATPMPLSPQPTLFRVSSTHVYAWALLHSTCAQPPSSPAQHHDSTVGSQSRAPNAGRESSTREGGGISRLYIPPISPAYISRLHILHLESWYIPLVSYTQTRYGIYLGVSAHVRAQHISERSQKTPDPTCSGVAPRLATLQIAPREE